MMVSTAMFEATVPYEPTLRSSMNLNIPRIPREQFSQADLETSISLAAFRVIKNIFIDYFGNKTVTDEILISSFPLLFLFSSHTNISTTDQGIFPNQTSTDITTAIGIGNFVGQAVIDSRADDGMNQV
jgi:hypothetical protein